MMELTEKQKNKLLNREYRSMTMQIAKSDENEKIVQGYASTFNQEYTLYEGRSYKVVEVIDPHAFDECDMQDVIFQYDHRGRVFARTRNKTLEVSIDSYGLFMKANLGGTDIGNQLFQEIQGGYTDRMSFGFVVSEDVKTYTTDHEKGIEICTRRITKVSKLYDVSAVSIPANDMTTISARNFSDGVIADFEAERLKRAKEKVKLKIKMMEV